MLRKSKSYFGFSADRCQLRENYDGFEQFEAYAETYGLHVRLGYQTPQEAWDDNPRIEHSTDPTEFCKIVNGHRQFFNLDGLRIHDPMDYDSLFDGLHLVGTC